MNNKQNYLNALNHKPTEWIPVAGVSTALVGFRNLWIEKGPSGGGYDGFGVRWVTPEAAGGDSAPIPAPGEFILKDITKWKEIHFPDLEKFNWEDFANECLANVNRDEMAIEFCCGNGQFERLAAFMGFEEALIAMYEEPEAVYDLFSAITDYKIELIKKVAKYIKPDTFTNFDDVATQNHPFMSPAIYKELVSPHHKRLNDACREEGIIPIIHCCGNAEVLAECFIEEGSAAWSPIQPVNDIAALCRKYGDKMAFIGGYDTNGLPGQTAKEEVILAEMRRCMDSYGKYPGYVFTGFLMFEAERAGLGIQLETKMAQEADKYSKKLAGLI